MTTTLIIPGLYSSGPGHWQTWLEEQLPDTLRVIQSDWKKPDLDEWSRRVRRDIARNPGRHIIVAHSFGVLAGIHAASGLADRIDGALLVAPADPDKFSVAARLPQQPLPFPAVVVASSNDPWMDLWTAASWADRWGADFVNLGDAGHINADFGLRRMAGRFGDARASAPAHAEQTATTRSAIQTKSCPTRRLETGDMAQSSIWRAGQTIPALAGGG